MPLLRRSVRERAARSGQPEQVRPSLPLEDTEAQVLPVEDQKARAPARGGLREDPLSGQVPCRICLLEGSTPDDPLIAPCSCSGSIRPARRLTGVSCTASRL